MTRLASHRGMLALTPWPDGGFEPVVTHLRTLEADRRAALAARRGTLLAAGDRRDGPFSLARSSVGMIVASLLDPPHGEAPEPYDAPVAIVDLVHDGCATGATRT
jgi:hypothetical protein